MPLGQWEGDLPGHCSPTIHLGPLREMLALVSSPLGSLEALTPLPEPVPGYSGFSRPRESGFLTKQRKSVPGYLQPREVFQWRISPKSLGKPWKLMEKSFLETKAKRIYLQLTLGDFPDCMRPWHLQHGAPPDVLLGAGKEAGWESKIESPSQVSTDD